MQSMMVSPVIPGGSQVPQWHAWTQAACDVEEARSILRDHPLKGMPDSIENLNQCRAIVFGTGATGGVLGGLLAQSGVGALDLVDPDTYGTTSFATQPAYYAHRGRPKALIQGEHAQAINPACRVRAMVNQAQDVLLRDLRKADIFLVAGDNLSLLIWAGRKALALSKPLVQVAVHGDTHCAIVRTFDLRDAANACPHCGMSVRELNDQHNRFGCDIDNRRPTQGEPTRTMPAICHVAAAFAANEALKRLARHQATSLPSVELVCSLIDYPVWRTELPRNFDCRLPHTSWQLRDLVPGSRGTTLGCLSEQLGQDRFETTTQVRSEIPWISFTLCGSCGRKATVRRFGRVGSAVGRCVCGSTVSPVPQGMRSVIPLDDLRACWDQPIASLGINSGEAIGILQDEQWVYFFPRIGSPEQKQEQKHKQVRK